MIDLTESRSGIDMESQDRELAGHLGLNPSVTICRCSSPFVRWISSIQSVKSYRINGQYGLPGIAYAQLHNRDATDDHPAISERSVHRLSPLNMRDLEGMRLALNKCGSRSLLKAWGCTQTLIERKRCDGERDENTGHDQSDLTW